MNSALAFTENTFLWTWKTSVSVSVLVVLVMLARKLLGRHLSPRLCYAFSLLIFIRLLLPVVPASSLSFENLFQLAPVKMEPSPTPSSLKPEPVIQQPDPQLPANNPQPRTPATSQFSLRSKLSLAWATGVLCLLIVAACRYRRWLRLIAEGQTITDPSLLELLNTTRKEMGIWRPVCLVTVARLSSPAVFGFPRPCLLLPENAASQLSHDELRLIFLHEMAHIRRHDLVLNVLMIVLQFLHWFNPLVWMANRWHRADRELVCDAMTLKLLPATERTRYGQVLLKLMAGISEETPVCAGMVPIVGCKEEIKRRLIMIKRQKQTSIPASLATAVVLIALGVVSFTRAQDVISNAAQPVGPLQAQNFIPRLPPANDPPAPDSVEGTLKAQGKKWELAPGLVRVGGYVKDIYFGRLDQPPGRGTIAKVISMDEYIGMEHAWVDFGRGALSHIRTSELCPIRFITSDAPIEERQVRVFSLQHSDPKDVATELNSLFQNPGAPGMTAGGGLSDGQKKNLTFNAVPDERTHSVLVTASKDTMVAVEKIVENLDAVNDTSGAYDSLEWQFKTQGKTWEKAPGPVRVGTYVQDTLPNRINQPAGRGTIGKTISLDEFNGAEHAWVDFGRGWTTHIPTAELVPLRIIPATNPNQAPADPTKPSEHAVERLYDFDPTPRFDPTPTPRSIESLTR